MGIFDSLFTNNKAVNKSAAAAQQQIQAGKTEGIGHLNDGEAAANGFIDQKLAATKPGYGAWMTSVGLNGFDQQDAWAKEALKYGPLAQSISQGQDAVTTKYAGGGGPGMYSGAAIQAGQRDATDRSMGYLKYLTDQYQPMAGQYVAGFGDKANVAGQAGFKKADVATGAASAGAQTSMWQGANQQNGFANFANLATAGAKAYFGMK